MPACCCRSFLRCQYLRLVRVEPAKRGAGGRAQGTLAFRQQTLALGGVCAVAMMLMTLFIDPVFATLTRIMIALLQTFGMQVAMPDLQPDAFPFWDSTMLVLSIAAMVLMTRKFVENWLLWVVIDVISVVIYAVQGVYAMSLEYVLLTAIAVMGSYSWIKSAQRNGYTPLAAAAS